MTAAASNNLVVTLASKDAFDPRQFTVQERVSTLFSVTLVVVCDNPDVEFDAVVGKDATFLIRTRDPENPTRLWSGVCSQFQQVAVEPSGSSTYELTIVPNLWLTTQRRNHRMFQLLSEPEIVLQLLAEWGIEPDLKIDLGAYKKRKYRVQYAESDYTFICRMLEDVGISFYFEQVGAESKLVLSDAPQRNPPRGKRIAFRDNPMTTTQDKEHVTHVHIGQQVRPGKYTLRDHDYRRPASYKLLATAAGSNVGVEDKLERFHYTPGAFLFKADRGGDSPVADDKGQHRHDEGEGAALAKKRLEAKRASAKIITFETNALDLAPGVVMGFLDHPRADLGDGKDLLIIQSTLSGTAGGHWTHGCEARSADPAFRPPLTAPKPKVAGVESATVVGPPGEEIHTDEFGRVRVHFHWDRESKMDDKSSCWIHVSQPWGGSGYGGSNLPRVGQEVLVDFLGGDPDRPVIIGRVYTNLQKVPYHLPANKTQSGWKSNSTNRTGGYNEMMFEDASGKELFRIQGEKDFQGLIKHDATLRVGHDATTSIGNDEATTIGHDEKRLVVHDQKTTVGNDRTVLVGHDQIHTVQHDISQQAVEGQTYLKSKERFTIESETEILIKVGPSTIFLSMEGIRIQGPKVSINPEG
jgi:type VI secretion system secreted protein VgrG